MCKSSHQNDGHTSKCALKREQENRESRATLSQLAESKTLGDVGSSQADTNLSDPTGRAEIHNAATAFAPSSADRPAALAAIEAGNALLQLQDEGVEKS
jgi:hypothetical protein